MTNDKINIQWANVYTQDPEKKVTFASQAYTNILTEAKIYFLSTPKTEGTVAFYQGGAIYENDGMFYLMVTILNRTDQSVKNITVSNRVIDKNTEETIAEGSFTLGEDQCNFLKQNEGCAAFIPFENAKKQDVGFVYDKYSIKVDYEVNNYDTVENQ
ncbi:hypothetical protein BMT55_08140 [Listeria newyorkensis]|uniref:DUF4352 domain-containing protein n=1 Tax=Listeria newyorkensis TaxID=1497681 RepID=A0ABX4XNB7_9LIST|nr:hypothetical protein [Listeria newyorkensis]PNP92529.1 hypothetical protein BMT55_08140 [Listeria newyorkensis]